MAKSLDGLHPTVMRPRVEAFLADPRAVALGITVVSAYRSPDYQAQLYRDAVAKYGPAKAGTWVAPPWHSDHGPVLDDAGRKVPYGPGQGGKWGDAVDIAVRNVAADKAGHWPAGVRAQVDAIALDHGLASPMAWEDWHYEPIPNWSTPKPPPQAPPAGLPAIRLPMVEGQSSPGIGFAQYLLNDLETGGKPPEEGGLAVDGDYGPKTTAAVKAFQKIAGHLTVNGVIDAATWATILGAYGHKHPK